MDMMECLKSMKVHEVMHREDKPNKWIWLESIAENGFLNIRVAMWAMEHGDFDAEDWVISKMHGKEGHVCKREDVHG